MNQVLMFSVLVGSVASYGMCQETPAPAPLSETAGVIRILFKSAHSEDLVPLTRAERLRIYFAHTYGVGSIFRAGAAAGFMQLTNTPSEWKHGSDGYRKRFTSSYATHVIKGTIEDSASALLHEDNRYRRSLETGWWQRSKHAITGAFSSTDQAGRRHFSYSRVGSIAATSFIRQTWQPHSTGGAGNSAASVGLAISSQVGTNLIREFLPDVKRHFVNK